MGYDMYWVEVPAEQVADVEVARKEWDAAVAARDALPDEERGRHTPEQMDAPGFHPFETRPASRRDRYQAAQDRVDAAADAMREAERSYFRLNIWGMGDARRVLEPMGVLFEAGEHPPWPEHPDGVVEEAVDALDEEGDVSRFPVWVLDQARTYLRTRAAVLSWHGPEVPGIPVHKLCSNDGWHVTPAECVAAASMFMAHPDRAAVSVEYPYVAKFVAWIAEAARHGGFRVH